jgi:AcrR family transcriptional regulator
MDSSGSPGRRGRGRPTEIDADGLSRVAVALFLKRDFDEVSAAEIAEAAGVSRRSLFRYFPSKADLVWHGFTEILEVLSASLREQADVPPTEAVARAIVAVAERVPVLDLTRSRLMIIASHPELMSMGVPRLGEHIDVCAAYLGSRGLDPLTARVQASALTIGSFTGYLQWATGSLDPTPVETVRRAVEAMRSL